MAERVILQARYKGISFLVVSIILPTWLAYRFGFFSGMAIRTLAIQLFSIPAAVSLIFAYIGINMLAKPRRLLLDERTITVTYKYSKKTKVYKFSDISKFFEYSLGRSGDTIGFRYRKSDEQSAKKLGPYPDGIIHGDWSVSSEKLIALLEDYRQRAQR